MRTMFIAANWSGDAKLSIDALKTLEVYKSITLFTAVNFLDQLPIIEKQLDSDVVLVKAKRTSSKGQLLGCDSYTDSLGGALNSDAILYVGDGAFHPDALLFAQIYSEKLVPVFRWNPKDQILEEWNVSRILNKVKKIKGNLLRFSLSKNIGVLVTLKQGQERLNDALKLKTKLEAEGKTVFVFIDDTFNFSKAEDFNYIDCFVNSACPRIAQEDGIVIEKALININEAFDVNKYLSKINTDFKQK